MEWARRPNPEDQIKKNCGTQYNDTIRPNKRKTIRLKITLRPKNYVMIQVLGIAKMFYV